MQDRAVAAERDDEVDLLRVLACTGARESISRVSVSISSPYPTAETKEKKPSTETKERGTQKSRLTRLPELHVLRDILPILVEHAHLRIARPYMPKKNPARMELNIYIYKRAPARRGSISTSSSPKASPARRRNGGESEGMNVPQKRVDRVEHGPRAQLIHDEHGLGRR